MNEIPLSPYWITVPIGIAMFAYLLYELRRRPQSPSPPTTSPLPPDYGHRTVTEIRKHEWAGDVATHITTSQEVTGGSPKIGDASIPMKAAATRLYDAFPRRFILERAKETLGRDVSLPLNDSAADLLKLAAKHIAAEIPVYGKDSSSGIFKRIIMNNLTFNDDVTQLEHLFYPTSPGGTYTEVAVRSDEFEAFLVEESRHQGFQEEFPSQK